MNETLVVALSKRSQLALFFRSVSGTFGGSDEHGTKGGFGGFAASCEREIADQTGSFALATWSILTKVRWQICTEIL